MEQTYCVEGGVSPDGVVGPSDHAQISTDSTGNPGVVSPDGVVSPEVVGQEPQNDTDMQDSILVQEPAETEHMETDAITQHRKKNNKNNNSRTHCTPEFSNAQKVQ